ncbi:MAG TPA: hypothetical protein VFS09_00390 [Candidatus Eisenbacteria bacterium]|nr:hypothetical protein [Candidatus Eisenbacteria bacterium]
MNRIVSRGSFRASSLALVALVAVATTTSISGCGGMKAEAEKDKTEVLAAGTSIVAALQSTISTGSANAGDPVVLRTTQAVRVNEMDVVPAGATIRGEVTHAKGAGRVAGGAELTLRFTTLETQDGKSYPITCEPFRIEGKGDAKESALEIAGGAVAGAIVGGVAGGKDDIAKGAAVGAVIGTGVAVATKGDQIVLPAGQKLKVTLTEGVTVTMPKPAPTS